MKRRFEQDICNVSLMNPCKKIKFTDWYMKKDSSLWIAHYFEYKKIPVDRTNKKHCL